MINHENRDSVNEYVRTSNLIAAFQQMKEAEGFTGTWGVRAGREQFVERTLPTVIHAIDEARQKEDHAAVKDLFNRWAISDSILDIQDHFNVDYPISTYAAEILPLVRARITAAFVEIAQIQVLDAIKQYRRSQGEVEAQEELTSRLDASHSVINKITYREGFPPLTHGYSAVYWPIEIAQVRSSATLLTHGAEAAEAELLKLVSLRRIAVVQASTFSKSLTPRNWPPIGSHSSTEILGWSKKVGPLSSYGVAEARLGKYGADRGDILRGFRKIVDANELDPNPARVREVRKWVLASALYKYNKGQFTFLDSLRIAINPRQALNDHRLDTLRGS